MMRKRTALWTSAAIIAALALWSPRASAQASAYVPLDDVSYGFVDALMSRGEMKNLSGLERPYTRGEIASGIDSARAHVTSPILISWLDALSRSISKYEVAPDSDSTANIHARFGGDLYGTGQTSARRELMLADKRNDVEPGATIRMVMTGGPIAGSIRGLIDNRLKVDPEFSGRKDRKVDGRIEDGYVGGQWKYGEITFGRIARNWGPPQLDGMQLGHYAYTYDQLYGKVGSRAIHISTVLARLDDDTIIAGPHIARYLSIHRLALRHATWEIGATESFLYTGVGRGFEPSLSNPFNIFALSWRNERADGNLAMGLDGAWRSKRLGIIAAQLFLDDLQIDKCDTVCHEPTSYGATLTIEGFPLSGDHRGFASYTRVSNLAYRTPNVHERYASFNVGLGRGFSDYDEARIGADLALVKSAVFRLYGAYRRQGEGDYRKLFPPKSAYPTTPVMFSGTVMKIARVGLTSSATRKSFELSADLGVNRASNADNVVGRTRSGFEGRVKLSWIPALHADF
jgi:hypothetical protein